MSFAENSQKSSNIVAMIFSPAVILITKKVVKNIMASDVEFLNFLIRRLYFISAKIWLGTFETVNAAARAYDEATILMNGHQAKTNFPVKKNNDNITDHDTNSSKDTLLSPPELLDILSAKLRKSCKINDSFDRIGP
ncbi:ethylene-responsive transcription factor SHINE 2-like [Olea europaea var. sylvestris]|uniref:ethylene-responsive transcription factor SHINE 2-like n=1 Tax=Olea europaea var. sylvestris TaxID=158386 RepID=UPI000C1D47D9|nr:ethylene-responsive transcription factor SHINE 2-like [Olea europaea var. sylvestris]